jgi:predicted nucleotidyltransferase
MSDTIPSASESDLPSGRFLLRIDPRLHASLREAARTAGVSLNEYCAHRLSPLALAEPGGPVVARAATLLGDGLMAVVAYGSWARNELAAGSDVDVLVVAERRIPITRGLYRRWDAEPVAWASHPVEPHFVHLPPTSAAPSGTWAEAAIDGVVLFDRDLVVSRRLVKFRRAIMEGRVVRRESHGQPYWVGAA